MDSAEFIDFLVDRSLAFLLVWNTWHAYILHLLAEMYDSIGIHELSRKGKELHRKLPNIMLAEMYEFFGNKCLATIVDFLNNWCFTLVIFRLKVLQ